jgi:hypothetical protein
LENFLEFDKKLLWFGIASGLKRKKCREQQKLKVLYNAGTIAQNLKVSEIL